MTPYDALEKYYWVCSRNVSVVDEINWLNQDSAEVICGIGREEEKWVNAVARRHGFEVKKEVKTDHGETYHRFVVSTKGYLN